MRPGLITGVNVDAVNIAAGLSKAVELGYTDAEDQAVIERALWRHADGEEQGAQRTWLSHFGRDFTSWYVILAVALVAAGGDNPRPGGGAPADSQLANELAAYGFSARTETTDQEPATTSVDDRSVDDRMEGRTAFYARPRPGDLPVLAYPAGESRLKIPHYWWSPVTVEVARAALVRDPEAARAAETLGHRYSFAAVRIYMITRDLHYKLTQPNDGPEKWDPSDLVWGFLQYAGMRVDRDQCAGEQYAPNPRPLMPLPQVEQLQRCLYVSIVTDLNTLFDDDRP